MFEKKIKIRKWIARTTNKEQGTASRSIKLGNKSIGKLSFKVSSDSPYWRAGFKLCSPNDPDIPLLDQNQNSLLFHVGGSERYDTMRISVYINGIPRKRNERIEYAKDEEVTLSFEVNKNNYITCLINDVQVFHERVNSVIFKKVYLLAWGDYQDGEFRQYEVKFRNVVGKYRNFQINQPYASQETKNL